MIYKIAYADVNNAGDQLNIPIMRDLFGLNFERASSYPEADISGIGSHLELFLYSDKKLRALKQRFTSYPETVVWGTGFLYPETDRDRPFLNKRIRFAAVRGELTKQRIERSTGTDLSGCVLGDGGLLASELFEIKPDKRYSVGIVPHYREKEEAVFKKLCDNYTGAVLIDITNDPITVCKTISECDTVLSSSLHGLIIADSFGIPNLHVKATGKPLGGGYKFSDYYSAFGLSDNWFDINRNYPSINEIIDRYKIRYSDVEKKKKELYDCFPYKQRKDLIF